MAFSYEIEQVLVLSLRFLLGASGKVRKLPEVTYFFL